MLAGAKRARMPYTRRGYKKERGRTRDFHVHADAPVDEALRGVDVEVAQADLAHARADVARLLVAGDADLVAAAVGLEEVIDEVEVFVVDLEIGVLDLELVEQLVEMLVLFLVGGGASREHARVRTCRRTHKARKEGRTADMFDSNRRSIESGAMTVWRGGQTG